MQVLHGDVQRPNGIFRAHNRLASQNAQRAHKSVSKEEKEWPGCQPTPSPASAIEAQHIKDEHSEADQLQVEQSDQEVVKQAEHRQPFWHHQRPEQRDEQQQRQQ